MLYPSTPFPETATVLTAPASRAAPCTVPRSVTHSNASSLNGNVTFRPRPPPPKNRSAAASKASAGSVPYARSSPVAAAKCAWMRGERLCPTGLPITA